MIREPQGSKRAPCIAPSASLMIVESIPDPWWVTPLNIEKAGLTM